MTMPSCFAKVFKYLVTAGLLSLNLLASSTHAQLMDTESVINSTQSSQERQRIKDALNREEVRDKLSGLGVNPADIDSRVDSLTDTEVQTLAADIDALPAGGRTDTVVILLLIIIIILLV